MTKITRPYRPGMIREARQRGVPIEVEYEDSLKPHLYNDMLILIEGRGNLTKSRKESLDHILQWFIERGIRDFEAKWRCQLSWNHKHLSKRDAQKRIKEVREAVRVRLPKLLKRLRVDWAESDERQQPVNLSFYFDRERLSLPRRLIGQNNGR